MASKQHSPDQEIRLRLHAVVAASRSNGPGLRSVIWVQGCARGCPGCCNPAAQGPTPAFVESASHLADRLARQPGIQGVTITGGEPMEQPQGLLEFLLRLGAVSSLSVVLFSGFTLEEIRRRPTGSEILALTDILIDGPYDSRRPLGAALRGSQNQRVHLLSSRYTASQVEAVPPAELLIAADGSLVMTGVGHRGI